MKKIILFIFISFMLTACYDRIEIEDRSLVTSVAFDTDGSIYDLSFEIPYTTALSDPENASENIEKLKHIDTASSCSLESAIEILNSRSPKNLYLGHTRSCIISENILKDPDSFSEVIDFLKNNRELDRRINIVTTAADTSSVLSSRTDNQPLFGVFLNNYYKNTHLTDTLSQTIPLDLHTLIYDLTATDNAVIPTVYINSDDSVTISD
ncbi:MAG: hypothetical protein IJ736_01650, partial [Firmicutes bacterium]|nr:hypothetical protein [Bacillota bacterium]